MRPSATFNHSTQADRRRLWEDFRNDRQLLSIYRVMPDELDKLHTVFLLSGYTDKSQLIDALKLLRRGWR